MFALLIVLAPVIVNQILGSKWQGTEILISLLAVIGILGLLGDAAVPLFNGLGYPNMFAALEIVQSVFLVISAWFFTANYGLLGVGLAWFPAIIASLLVSLYYLQRLLEKPFKGLGASIVTVMIASVVGMLTTFILDQVVPGILGLLVAAAGENVVVVVTSTTPSIQRRPRLKFDSMSGGNIGTSLVVFKKVELFEEDPVMSTAEDSKWAYRALRKGVSIRYEPEVVVVHFSWRDAGKRIEQYRHYALSHGGFLGKYLRRGDIFILARTTVLLLREMRRWIRGKLSGNVELAIFGRAYCLNLLPGILAGVRSKNRAGALK